MLKIIFGLLINRNLLCKTSHGLQGIQPKGMSKRDIIIEINKQLQNDAVYDKIFQKIPGASGTSFYFLYYKMKHIS